MEGVVLGRFVASICGAMVFVCAWAVFLYSISTGKWMQKRLKEKAIRRGHVAQAMLTKISEKEYHEYKHPMRMATYEYKYGKKEYEKKYYISRPIEKTFVYFLIFPSWAEVEGNIRMHYWSCIPVFLGMFSIIWLLIGYFINNVM